MRSWAPAARWRWSRSMAVRRSSWMVIVCSLAGRPGWRRGGGWHTGRCRRPPPTPRHGPRSCGFLSFVDVEEHADPLVGEFEVAFVDVDAGGVAAHAGGDSEGGA